MPSVRSKRIFRSIERFGSLGSWIKVAPRVVSTKCQASYPVSYPGKKSQAEPLLNSESASARFPFSNVPEKREVGVGAGAAVGVEEENVGVGLGARVEIVGVGEGEGVLLAAGVGDGVAVGTNVAVPDPGQVCESLMPESTLLIVAKEPD